MLYERIASLFILAINMIGLMICMLSLVNRRKRVWGYAVFFTLANLLSNYYWGAYVFLMGDYPDSSSFMAYFGWDICYLPLIFLLLKQREGGERRYFSPLALLPIPLNIWQFTLYIQFGGLFNNIWQGLVCTTVACLSLNSILYYRKNRKNGAGIPYIAIFVLIYIALEYAMWTCSCFEWPDMWRDPYTYLNVLCYLIFLTLPWAIKKQYNEGWRISPGENRNRFLSGIKSVFILFVAAGGVGGFALAIWLKNAIDANMPDDGSGSMYHIIAVALFLTALVIAAITIALIVIVVFGQRADVAEHSNAAKSDFLANMSHEIRTPINAVLGMNEMILRDSMQARDNLPEDREELHELFDSICLYAGNVNSAGNNLLSIINDILDFSKIEAGRFEIVETNYQLSAVLNDVCNMIDYKAGDKGLAFRVDVDSNLPDVLYGDEVRIRQVITNVLNNAVKYTQKGVVVLSVRGKEMTREDGSSGISLKIAVRDTGIGIRKEDVDKLFSKFERLDLQKNSSIEGTGLGLAITVNLLSMMGGSIDVKSTYGKGSTFTITLPQRVVSWDKIGDFHEKFENRIKSTETYHESFTAPEARILVVDDTQMNLTVVLGLLKKTEMRIDTCNSGKEAIERAVNTRYDVILMDQRMPELDGTQAMKAIREQHYGSNADTVIICLTADAVMGARERYLAEGYSDYLTKPIEGEKLEAMLMQYLPPEKVHRETQKPKDEPVKEDIQQKNEPADRYASLREVGVDIRAGMDYCNEDEELYAEVLREYADSYVTKADNLQQYYLEKDWENYGVIVHSVKSSSRMIGAGELADLAENLENLANEGDESSMKGLHEKLLILYAKTAAKTAKAISD